MNQTNNITTVSTVTSPTSNIRFKNITPGPGAYNFQSKFPAGPKPVIQRKTKFDSLYGYKISQNVSPGPAAYTIRRKLGGTHQTIGQKFNNISNNDTRRVGPGSYNVSSATLKKAPSVVIGRMARYFGINLNDVTPDPAMYN